MKNILVSLFTSIPFWNIPKELIDKLRDEFPGHNFMISTSKTDYLSKLKSADTLLCWNVRKKEIENSSLKEIIFCMAGIPDGFKREDYPNIKVTNFSGINSVAVSEFTVGLVLNLFKKYYRFSERRKIWQTKREVVTENLSGSTATILGLGHIGQEIAKRLDLLGMTVYGTKRNTKDIPHVQEVVKPAEMYPILERSNLVVSALPLNPTTRRSIGEKELFSIKEGGYFINISRGGVLREEALLKALKENHLGGAALDVFQSEPLPEDSSLYDCPNLIMTPHIAGTYSDFWDDLMVYLKEALAE